jgi:hypothetical protein
MSVHFKTVDVNGLKLFYREAGDAPGRSCFCCTVFRARAICSEI